LNEIIELMTNFAKKNAKVFIAFLFIVFLLLLVLFPYINANFLMFNRIAQRIDILYRVSSLDYDAISQNIILMQEYYSILNEIYQMQNRLIGSMALQEQNPFNYYVKFISGGLVFWVVGFVILFQRDKDNSKKLSLFIRIASTVVCALMGWGLAFFATRIPTIGSVWANAILFPLILFAIVSLLIYGLYKKTK